MRVADYIAKRLEIEGIKSVFLLSGGGMMHLLDALVTTPGIQVVSQHHEQSCGFAADAYARISGQFGVAYGTSGPGATNLVTAVVNSWQDSIPVLYITGQSKLVHTIRHSKIEGLRQYGTFEVDILPIVQSITKYSHFLSDPNDIDHVMDRAIDSLFSGRPGPALIDIPVDIQGALVNKSLPSSSSLRKKSSSDVMEASVRKVLEKVLRFKRPLILAGHGVRMGRAAGAFRSFIERLNVPTVITPMASDLLEFNHPLCIGRPGVKGDRAGNISIQNADCILTLGCSLHAMTTGYELDKFAPKAYKIQVEIDQALQKKELVGVAEKHSWDVKSFLEVANSLLFKAPEIKAKDAHLDWIQHCLRVKKDLDVKNEPHATHPTKYNFYEVLGLLNEASQNEDVIIVDAGLPFYLVGHAFKVKPKQRVMIPGALGQMGYALPAATGAAMATSRRIFVLIGDGSFQTNIHELSVYKHRKPDIKVFLVNNNGYVSIRNTQNNYFNSRLIGTDPEHGVAFPDHRLIAEANDIPYFAVLQKEGSQSILEKFLAVKGPAIVEFFVPESQEVIPSVQSQKLADGSMVSKALHDMYPYLKETDLKKYYIGDK